MNKSRIALAFLLLVVPQLKPNYWFNIIKGESIRLIAFINHLRENRQLQQLGRKVQAAVPRLVAPIPKPNTLRRLLRNHPGSITAITLTTAATIGFYNLYQYYQAKLGVTQK